MSDFYVKPGDSVTFAKTVGESDIYLFAGITGDFSVNHVNEQYMARSKYGRRIAHGAKQPDIVYVTAHYRSRMIAHFNLSWMSPVKVRRVAIGGSKQMVLWDDLNNEERLKIYNSGIETRPEEQRILYRIGDIYSPRVPTREAVANVVEEFRRAIKGDKKSLIDGSAGLRVVRMLEAAQASLDRRFAALAALNASAEAGAALSHEPGCSAVPV